MAGAGGLAGGERRPTAGELLRLHRKLLATCCEPDAHPERGAWQSRVVGLIESGVAPCVPRETLVLPGGVPMTFAFVPPGEFLMGGTELENEKPVHRVRLTRGFYVGVHPVTQGQYAAVTGESPSRFTGDRLPVETVSWDDAAKFCGLLSEKAGRAVELPTEAEWEYVCRAGTTTAYHFGPALNGDRGNCDGNYPFGTETMGAYQEKTTEVGSYPANAWGLDDLHGNVWEWCRDFYGPYAAVGGMNDPVQLSNQSGNRRVLRGGCWRYGAWFCRAASRYDSSPVHRNGFFGFRVCFRLD